MMRLLVILLFTCACNFTQAQVNIITTIAGTGVQGFLGENVPATNAKFDHPNQLCLDNFGNLYISDAFNHRIRKIVLATGVITTVAGKGTGGYSGDGFSATDAELFIPSAVCTDTAGNIYIGDAFNSRIRKVDVSTGIITTIAGNGSPGYSGDGNPAISAQIRSPGGLVIDLSGNLYIADVDNHNIRKVTTAGIITTVAGNGTLGYSGDGGPATAAQFNSPGDMGVDSFGNVLIGDSYNHVIRKVNSVTGIITTIAGNGSPGYSGDGGPASNAQLRSPYGIFINRQNDIFIVEAGNGTIRKIDAATGIITTEVGIGVVGFAGDGGPATNAQLRPDDVFLDNFGTMYIADYRNHRIRKVYNPYLSIGSPDFFFGEVFLYPNPVQNELTIEAAKECDVKIYNLLGQEVFNAKKLSEREVLNIEHLISGVYVVEIVHPATMAKVSKRLVVAK